MSPLNQAGARLLGPLNHAGTASEGRSTPLPRRGARDHAATALLALALLIVAGAGPAIAAGARMTAEIRPTEIPLGQSARLVVTISGVQNAPAPRIPAIDGVEIQGLGQTTSVQIVNGAVNAEVSHNFLLEPSRTGTFTIPALTALLDGERLATSPLSLRVIDANAVPRGAMAPKGGPDDDAQPAPVSLRVTAPQRDFYVGELIPVELTLHIREGVRVNEVTAPTFAGNAFTVSRPQDGQPTQTTEVVDGVRWIVASFPLAISPVSAGEVALEGKIEVTAYVPGGRRRFGGMMNDPLFDSLFGGGTQRRIPLSSAPRTVRVLPLPDAGRPAEFSGAIGSFSVSATATPKQVTVGDPVTLTVTVSGKGNFDRLTIPAMASSADWKTYTASGKFDPGDALGHAGRKVSEQAIVPQNAKVGAVPPRPFSYFDPEKRRYVELATQPVALSIVAAPRPATAPGVSGAGVPAAPEDGAAADQWELAPNQIALGAGVPETAPVTAQPWFLVLQIAPLALLAVGTLWARRRDRLRADPAHNRRLAARHRVDAESAAMQHAARAGDTRAFFAAARRAIRERLAHDPARTAESLTLAELEELVGERSELREELRTIVGRADAVTYSGEHLASDTLEDWLRRTTALLVALDGARTGRR